MANPKMNSERSLDQQYRFPPHTPPRDKNVKKAKGHQVSVWAYNIVGFMQISICNWARPLVRRSPRY